METHARHLATWQDQPQPNPQDRVELPVPAEVAFFVAADGSRQPIMSTDEWVSKITHAEVTRS